MISKGVYSTYLLTEEHYPRNNKPFPKVGSVDDEQCPEYKVQQMSPVEYLGGTPNNRIFQIIITHWNSSSSSSGCEM